MLKEAIQRIETMALAAAPKLHKTDGGELFTVLNDGNLHFIDKRSLPLRTRDSQVFDLRSMVELIFHVWPDFAISGTVFIDQDHIVACLDQRLPSTRLVGPTDPEVARAGGRLVCENGGPDTITLNLNPSTATRNLVLEEAPNYLSHDEFIRACKLEHFGQLDSSFLPIVRTINTKRHADGQSSVQHAAAQYGQQIARQILTTGGEAPPETVGTHFQIWDNIPSEGEPDLHAQPTARLDIKLTDFTMALLVPSGVRSLIMREALLALRDRLSRLFEETIEPKAARPVIVLGSY